MMTGVGGQPNYHRMKKAELIAALQHRDREVGADTVERAQRTILETIPIPIAVVSQNSGRFMYSNKASAELLGIASNELVGSEAALVYANPEDRQRFVAELDERGQVDGFEAEFQSSNGEKFWVLLAARVIAFQGEAAVLASLTVISQSKSVEAELQRSEARIKDAIESISDGFIYYDADEKLVLSNQKYRDFYPWIEEVLAPGVQLEQVARLAAERGQDADTINDIEGWVANRLAEFRQGRRNHEQHLSDGRWLLCSESRTKDGGLVGIRTDITERKLVEETLRDREERSRVTFENAAVGLADVDLTGTYLRVNDRYSEILGFDPGELIGKTFRDVTHPDRLHVSEENLRQLREGEVEDMVNEKMYRRKDGEVVWGNLWASLVRDSDAVPSYYVTVLVDITEAKLTEAQVLAAKDAAAAAEARMTDAIENVSEGFALFDADDHLVMSNSRYREMYGYAENDVPPGTPLAELIALDIKSGAFADDSATVDAMNRRTRTYGETDETYDVPLADGRWIQIRDRHTSDGGTVSIHADVTQRRRAEEEIAEKESLLRVALDNMPGGIRLVDKERRNVLFNQRYGELFDFPDDLMKVGESVIAENIFQAERGEFGEGDPETLAKEWLKSLGSFDKPANWERTTISGRSLDCRTQPTEHGGYVSIITDVTDSKLAEAALRENEALLKSFLDNASSPMFVKDAEGRYLMVNKAFADNRGLSPDDMIGMTSRDLFDHGHAAAFDSADKEVMTTRQRQEAEVQVTQADGTIHDLLVSRFPVIAADGTLIAIGSVSIDITNRKRTEAALQESEARLTGFLDYANVIVIIKDPDLRYLMVNKAFVEERGVAANDIVGKTAHDFYSPEVARQFDESDQLILDTGQSLEAESHFVNAAGEKRDYHFVKYPVFAKDGSISAIGSMATDITERKRAEAALQEREAQLRVVLDNVPGGIRYVDNDKRYVFFNKQYSDLYGFPDGLLKVGESNRVENLFQAERGDFGDGDAAELTDEWLVELPVETEPQRWERTTVHGKTLQINTAPAPSGGVVNIVTDITDQKKAQQAVRESEQRLYQILESSPIGATIVRNDGRFDFVNSRTAEMVGVSKEELLGAKARDFYADPAERDAISERLQREGRLRDVEARLKRADGTPFWILLSFEPAPMDDGNAYFGWVYDISERKRVEEELKAARDEAERMADAKSDFVAVVSHEVRTPMNGVLGMARLMQDTNLDTEQRDYVDSIVASGDALLTILNDLLDISKLEADKLDLENVPFALDRAAEDAVAVMAPSADEKGISLICHVADDLPAAVMGDPHRLRQILLNLVSNAVKFTAEGTVTVRADEVKRLDNVATVCFAVTDSGTGISVDAQAKLFSDYTQGSVEVARKYGGTGLGLAICRRLANLMGGTIELESELGLGSTFRLLVPFPVIDPDAMETSINAGAGHGEAQLEVPLDILLVEDNEINRKVAIGMLGKQGHRVEVAVNGTEALERLKPGRFDVILMDRHMPVMGGIATTKRIRAMDGELAAIPIIGVTAAANIQELEACLAAGMNACVTKPIDPAALDATLARVMRGESDAHPENADAASTGAHRAPGSGEGEQPVFDIAALDALRADYGNDMVVTLVEDFQRICTQTASDLAAAAIAGDAETLQRTAHDLKSNARTMGLMKLAQRCLDIENHCIANKFDDAEHLADTVSELLADGLGHLEGEIEVE